MSNYSAVVVKLDNIRKHTNADRLQITEIFGNTVIVGLDAKIGDIGLFFPLESQIGYKFATDLDLIRRKDESGKAVGGMFEQNCRVRPQTLRGEKSMGFFLDIPKVYKFLVDNGLSYEIKVGQEIEYICEYPISKKYVVPTNLKVDQAKKSNRKIKNQEVIRVLDANWNFHFDTSHLGRNLHNIHDNSLVSITWKLHGTSGIMSNNLVVYPHTKLQRFLSKFIDIPRKTGYQLIASSRKVIKYTAGIQNKQSGYYKTDIWTDIALKYGDRLHKGETVYYEAVGHTSDGSMIQKSYDYGCTENEHKVFVYRITMTNPDGVVYELPWNQVKHRSKELGLEVCPEIYYGYVSDFVRDNKPNENSGTSRNFWDILTRDYVYDQDSKFCKNKVPEEGVIVRVEYGSGITNYKYKSFAFSGYEAKLLDSGEEDLESSQS